MKDIGFQEVAFWEIKNLAESTDPAVLSAMVGTSISANFTINQTPESEKTPEQLFYDSIEQGTVFQARWMHTLRNLVVKTGVEDFMNNSMTEALVLVSLFTKEEHVKMAQIVVDNKPGSMYQLIVYFLKSNLLSKEVLAIVIPFLLQRDKETLGFVRSYFEKKHREGNYSPEFLKMYRDFTEFMTENRN